MTIPLWIQEGATLSPIILDSWWETPERKHLKPYICCDKFEEAYGEGIINQSDDDDGFLTGGVEEGMMLIKYCPFCAKKITWTDDSSGEIVT